MTKAKALKTKQTLAKPSADYSSQEAQERFERAVDAAVVTKPMHRETVSARKRRRK